jgi:hypothetical protein
VSNRTQDRLLNTGCESRKFGDDAKLSSRGVDRTDCEAFKNAKHVVKWDRGSGRLRCLSSIVKPRASRFHAAIVYLRTTWPSIISIERMLER